jgi:hypothetical protein
MRTTDVQAPTVAEVDAFDLPEWLGESEVTWRAESSIRGTHHLTGDLLGGADPQPCDLLAADIAYPQPVLDGGWRRAAHQQWTHGQVLLVEYDGRLTLVVPGTEFTADRVLESLARLAKAVGVKPARFVAALRL